VTGTLARSIYQIFIHSRLEEFDHLHSRIDILSSIILHQPRIILLSFYYHPNIILVLS